MSTSRSEGSRGSYDDERAVEDGEILERLADVRVEHVALRLADALEGIDGELLALLHHRRRIAEDEDGPDRMALEPFVPDRHRQRDQRLDDLRRELSAETLGVDRRLLLEPAADLETYDGVGKSRTRPAGHAEDILALLEGVGGDGRDQRDFHFLDARVVVRRDRHAHVALLPQVLGELVLADGVDDLPLDRPPAQVVLAQGEVHHDQQVIDRRLRGQGQNAAEELPVELAVRHEKVCLDGTLVDP
ncbi:MAG: hypothetical protein LC689_05050 [Myxococcales bacterium]|nr:hypothetical protein [Myxococcales bacterium]